MFFDRCRIHCLGSGYITAASTERDVPHGYVFSHCTITAAPDVKTYLGRPWRDFAAVAWLDTEMPDAVRPEGWNNWGKPEREKTVRYAEFHSSGPGANPGKRVAWAKPLTPEEAAKLTPEAVLAGSDGWKPD